MEKATIKATFQVPPDSVYIDQEDLNPSVWLVQLSAQIKDAFEKEIEPYGWEVVKFEASNPEYYIRELDLYTYRIFITKFDGEVTIKPKFWARPIEIEKGDFSIPITGGVSTIVTWILIVAGVFGGVWAIHEVRMIVHEVSTSPFGGEIIRETKGIFMWIAIIVISLIVFTIIKGIR